MMMRGEASNGALSMPLVAAKALIGIALALWCWRKIGSAGPWKSLYDIFLNLEKSKREIKPIGFYDKRYQPVIDTFIEQFREGYEIGSQIHFTHKGEVLIDVAIGFDDPSFQTPLQKTTLQHVFSSGKAIEAVVIAMLVDRGLLDYEERISKYWPKFGEKGNKEHVTIATLMQHQAGLFALKDLLTEADAVEYCNCIGTGREETCGLVRKLEEMELIPEFYGKTSYHAITRGLITNEICRRVDHKHRSMTEFIEEEIVRPLNLEGEYYLGMPTPEDLAKLKDQRKTGNGFEPGLVKFLTRTLWHILLPFSITSLFFQDAKYHAGPGNQRFLRKFLFENNTKNDELEGEKPTKLNATYFGFRMIYDMGRKLGMTNWSEAWKRFNNPSTNSFATAKGLSLIGMAMTDGRLFSSNSPALAKLIEPTRLQYDYGILKKMHYTYGGLLMEFLDVVLAWNFTENQFARKPFHDVSQGFLGGAGAGGSFLQWNAKEKISFGYTSNYYGDDWRGANLLSKAYDIAMESGTTTTTKSS